MESKRSFESISDNDLRDLYVKSMNRLKGYFILGRGEKWRNLYSIKKPLAVALCQGAAMHYYDGVNGIKDFDVWFFYPYNQEHLPYRTNWPWDYENPKFGRDPSVPDYRGRRVDVWVRSIRNYTRSNPVKTIYQYLELENTESSRKLAKKAVVMLSPKSLRGRVVWYKRKI